MALTVDVRSDVANRGLGGSDDADEQAWYCYKIEVG